MLRTLPSVQGAKRPVPVTTAVVVALGGFTAIAITRLPSSSVPI